MSQIIADTLKLIADNQDVILSAMRLAATNKEITMETLKISDLSVGDWVEYEGLHYPITFVGYGEGGDGSLVNLIRPDLSCFTCKISDIHPIPITPEILEKIGFERLLERDLFYHSESGLEVAFEDEEWMHTINLHEYTIHTISGVHHIQHLLRLYGCEKEINL